MSGGGSSATHASATSSHTNAFRAASFHTTTALTTTANDGRTHSSKIATTKQP